MVDRTSGRRIGRRAWLRAAGATTAATCGAAFLPASIQKALAIPAARVRGTIEDVQHVVILMQENRSFDHYFGTMSGVRGFGDRKLVPLAGTKSVWSQSDGTREILPFHLDTHTTTAMRVPGAPHSWPDAQQAWGQGRMCEWPRFKEFQSMGYYESDDIPFQRALADAFTICDAHHCSIQSGTLANRTVFMTGTNCQPGLTVAPDSPKQSLIDNGNNRGSKVGAYSWTTYPERLQAAGVSWRIYQDPADNWGGLLAPWETFVAYQTSHPGDPLYENAMSRWPLETLAQHVMDGSLPQVSWVIPSPVWSEHPAESSPLQGAAYVQKVLEILTSNPEVWANTVFIVTFDENDGLFDHAPPPAPPSIDDSGRVLGGSTLPEDAMRGLYFRNAIAGTMGTRPCGLGPRVPMYIVSPWSRGGWVCSQVFDHTSTIRFLEARFGVMEPNISAWHRAVSGDLTSCFDFARPNEEPLPELPDMSAAKGETLVITGLAPVTLPKNARMPTQDTGVRFSRALPYRLAVHAKSNPDDLSVALTFENTGTAGAVVHVYDRLHLDRVPYRYTIEAGKTLAAPWDASGDAGAYDLYMLGPNGLLWHYTGQVPSQRVDIALPEVELRVDGRRQSVALTLSNLGDQPCEIETTPNAYHSDRALTLTLHPGDEPSERSWAVRGGGLWYDFSVTSSTLPGWLRRFAGRVETGRHGLSDPALGWALARKC